MALSIGNGFGSTLGGKKIMHLNMLIQSINLLLFAFYWMSLLILTGVVVLGFRGSGYVTDDNTGG